jgi:branched-chain amino acid transport system permease protein
MRGVSWHRNAALMVCLSIRGQYHLHHRRPPPTGGFPGHEVRPDQQTADSSWTLLGLKAFVAAVVGGIGNVRGAMLGGLAIGLLEQFGSTYLSSSMQDVYVFGVLILVLLVRPGGILGKAIVEKV